MFSAVLKQVGWRYPFEIVMMSGYVAESARVSLEGVTSWVQKPVRVRRLGATIQEALAPRG